MSRDSLLSSISIRMGEIQKELDELYKAKKKLVDEQTNLIASWNKETGVSRKELDDDQNKENLGF
jgi:hypothetical protein